jgi:hypothetical protein
MARRYSAKFRTVILVSMMGCFAPWVAAAASDDEAAIRALEDRFAAPSERR